MEKNFSNDTTQAPLDPAEIQKNTEAYRRCLAEMPMNIAEAPNVYKAAKAAVAICNEAILYDLPPMEVR